MQTLSACVSYAFQRGIEDINYFAILHASLKHHVSGIVPALTVGRGDSFFGGEKDGDLFWVRFVSDSMFDPAGDCRIERCVLGVEDAKKIIAAGVTSCLNRSHTATVEAMVSRFGIFVEVPERPPVVGLHYGDAVLVMGVRGLPRLEDRHHYSEAEVAGATFRFTLYTVAA